MYIVTIIVVNKLLSIRRFKIISTIFFCLFIDKMLREASFYAPPDMLSERRRGEYNIPYISRVNAQERMFNGQSQINILVGLGDHTRDLDHPLYAFLLNML